MPAEQDGCDIEHEHKVLIRLPTLPHISLKHEIGGRLFRIYMHVGTPSPSPETFGLGDLDFVVCKPRGLVGPEEIRSVLRARYVVSGLNPEKHINHLAVMAAEGKFVQVNVEVCQDELEFDRIVFIQSHGDLGKMLSVLARAHGLSLGPEGLQVRVCIRV